MAVPGDSTCPTRVGCALSESLGLAGTVLVTVGATNDTVCYRNNWDVPGDSRCPTRVGCAVLVTVGATKDTVCYRNNGDVPGDSRCPTRVGCAVSESLELALIATPS